MLHLSAGRSFPVRRLCLRNSNIQNASGFNADKRITNVTQLSAMINKHATCVLLTERTNYRASSRKHESNVTTLTRFINIQQHRHLTQYEALKKENVPSVIRKHKISLFKIECETWILLVCLGRLANTLILHRKLFFESSLMVILHLCVCVDRSVEKKKECAPVIRE